MHSLISKKRIGFLLGAILTFGFVALSLANAPSVLAQATTPGPLGVDELFGGDVTGGDFADTAGLGGADLVDTIGQIIRVALGFLGVVAVVIILLGGFKWMTAGGNDDKLKKAKGLLFSGIIGLVIILSAYAIASFVLSSLVTATTGGE